MNVRRSDGRRTIASGTIASGFSLTELLLAMSLFSVLGMGMIALLSRSTDFLNDGASATETLDALQTFSETFESDVRTLYTQPRNFESRPDVRLYSDFVESDVGEDGKPDVRLQRLFFVRLIPGEATNRVTRRAGVNVEQTKMLDQDADLAEAFDGLLRPTGGLMEVFWMMVPESEKDLAVCRLYRGFRSPIGGEKTLLPIVPSNDPSATDQERGPVHLKDVKKVARPILSGVLYFGVEFWSRRTKTWKRDVPPQSGGPLPTWDSSRGVLPKSALTDGFYYAKVPDAAGFGGEEWNSLDDPTDDTFPRRLRVIIVVEELGRNAKTGLLDEAVSVDDATIPLADTRFLPGTEAQERYVKIDGEWIRFEGVDGNTLTGCSRGRRGTIAKGHKVGAIVHHGRTLVREFALATFRDTYSDELPSLGGRGGLRKRPR